MKCSFIFYLCRICSFSLAPWHWHFCQYSSWILK